MSQPSRSVAFAKSRDILYYIKEQAPHNNNGLDKEGGEQWKGSKATCSCADNGYQSSSTSAMTKRGLRACFDPHLVVFLDSTSVLLASGFDGRRLGKQQSSRPHEGRPQGNLPRNNSWCGGEHAQNCTSLWLGRCRRPGI
eukprot:6479460-Amphidinium_carterae.2